MPTVILTTATGPPAENLVTIIQPQVSPQLLNKTLTEKDKERVVLLLWQIAYADGRLDKYEDSMVSKIADLLYVSRVRVMRLKHDVNSA